MTLTFSPNGDVYGTYHDAGSAIPHNVQGSLKGREISFIVPAFGRLAVRGRIEPNGDIDGYGTPLAGSSTALYVFTASLVDRSPQNPHR